MKAILVIDIPDDYEEYGSGDWYIIGDDLKIVYEENGALPTYKYIDDDMAQLKPMPEKKMLMKFEGRENKEYEGLVRGYNKCIDEILGVENETE